MRCAYGEIDYLALDETRTTKDFLYEIDWMEWGEETCLGNAAKQQMHSSLNDLVLAYIYFSTN